MNDKDSKVPIIIAVIVALILVATGGYFVLGGPPKEPVKPPEPTPTATPLETETAATATPGTAPTATATPTLTQPTVKCELCHTNPQDLNPHVNGGKFCINCHGSQVHNIHIGPGTVNLQCESCHGFPPKIPTIEAGAGPGHYAVCENCHAPPPDSLKPSLGNLIVVHLSRGKYCTNCHGTDIGEIHAAALANLSNRSTK